jgi:hypothetical protein
MSGMSGMSGTLLQPPSELPWEALAYLGHVFATL